MVSSKGQSGGLALLWKPDTKVHVKNFSRWFINAHVFCETIGISWRLIGFYRHPENVRKLALSLTPLVKQITFPGFALVISMRLQASLRKRVVAYGQHAKWIIFALSFTIVASLTLDMLAFHSHGPETTLLKVVFISS